LHSESERIIALIKILDKEFFFSIISVLALCWHTCPSGNCGGVFEGERKKTKI